MRLFDADPEIVQAFAHTGIAVSVTVPIDHIPQLTKLSVAQQWIRTFIVRHIPATNIKRILAGNEVSSSANKLLVTTLVPAMQTLHAAIAAVFRSTNSDLNSFYSEKFHQVYDIHVLNPLLSFLKDIHLSL